MSLEEIEKRIEELDVILEKKEKEWWDKKRNKRKKFYFGRRNYETNISTNK